MPPPDQRRAQWARRAFLWGISIPLITLVLVACDGQEPADVLPVPSARGQPAIALGALPVQAPTLSPEELSAPDCRGPIAPTLAIGRGSHFRSNSPERASLIRPHLGGKPLILTGYVFTRSCRPVAHALLEFWQADANGRYDTVGYDLHGHQYTDPNGRYQLETIIPGEPAGRAEHIDVEIEAPHSPTLTTKLFFPGDPDDASDPSFNPRLVMTVYETGNTKSATFDFVVNSE